MNVLVACEESQEVCKAFRALGHEAYSCDIQECSGGHPEWHIKGDAIKYINGDNLPPHWKRCAPFPMFLTQDGKWHTRPKRWDLIIAHPPCTYMTNAGAVRMRVNGEIVPERFEKAMEEKKFFMKFYSADCPKIAIENPTPMKIVGLPPLSAGNSAVSIRAPIQQANLFMVERTATTYAYRNCSGAPAICKRWLQGRARELPALSGA